MIEKSRRQLRVVITPARDATMELLDVLLAVPAHVHDVVVVRGGENDGTADLARYLWPSVRVLDVGDTDAEDGTPNNVGSSSDVVLRLPVVPVHRRTDRATAGLLALLHDVEHAAETAVEPAAQDPFARWRKNGPFLNRPPLPRAAPVRESVKRRESVSLG